MEVYEAILAKRDRRSYDLSRRVPEDIIDRLLQAGRMAGSSKNEQPIRAIVLTDSEIKASLSRCADYSDHLPTSPLVIVIVRFEGSRAFDAGRVAQNIMLAASGLGLDSCPVGVQHDDCARSVLALPDDWIVAMAITLGYATADADDRARSGERRIAKSDWVKWNQWS